MSKRARTATVAKVAHTGKTTLSVPRTAHEHSYTMVKTSGNRIRRGCVCGSWLAWRQMTTFEIAGYRPQLFVKRLGEATKPVLEALHSARGTFANLGDKLKEYGVMPDQPAPEKKDVRALLAQVRSDAVDDTAHEVDRITDEAGVDVQDDNTCGSCGRPNPPSGCAINCGARMDDATWYDDVVIDPREFPHAGSWKGDELPDRDDDHSLAITEDFEPEPTIDPKMYCAHGVHLDANDRSCCEEEDGSYQEEYDPEQDKDMCYLVLGNNTYADLLPREDAHQELDTWLKAHPNGKHQIGDALWDDTIGEWKLPPDVMDSEDETALVNFVAESFGVDGDPDQVAVEDHKPTWQIKLDYGNETTDTLAWDGWDYGASHLIQRLNTKKRDDLEFAARKLGIRGVTTKVRKELLIRALVVMADTSLVPEHALNRAAVMLRTAPVKDSDTEWAAHYGDKK